jgi:hypothetical protein
MRALLEAGADPRQKWSTSYSEVSVAVHACRRDDVKVTELLLQFGISVNEKFDGTSLLGEAVSSFDICSVSGFLQLP